MNNVNLSQDAIKILRIYVPCNKKRQKEENYEEISKVVNISKICFVSPLSIEGKVTTFKP